MKRSLCFVFLLLPLLLNAQQTIRYDLNITDTIVDYTNKRSRAIAINGQVPGPTLYFTEGDTALIYVHNHMHHETSVHWHGLLLPNEQDGVPHLTTAPIKGHSTAVYKFPLRQSGTYWYHSHSMLQEQSGMYGAFIIQPKKKLKYKEEVLLLSDWSKEKPEQIERSLHFATDWYAIKKHATQDYAQALLRNRFGTKLMNELKRMHAMDVSDVYYQRFFVNGQREEKREDYQSGDTIRLRVINGSSSTYFWLNYSGGRMAVVASDGSEVEPVWVDRLIVGVSESYDVLVTLPSAHAYEFTATSEDRTGRCSLWLGKGDPIPLPSMKRLHYFEGMKMMNDMMTLGGNMHDMGMNMSLQQMDMNAVMYPELTDEKADWVTLNYSMLKSPVSTVLPDTTVRTLNFELTGNMNRYVWTVNHKTISESDKILIKEGENIRIIITNNSMMRHPMHLHGHFFRVLNGQGDHAPLKNVLDIMPMETDTIEFNASEGYGDWYFHCHILYHMMSGMGRIFQYENSPANPELPDPKKAQRMVYRDDRRFYLGGNVSLESNGSDGEVFYSNTRWVMEGEWRVGLTEQSGYEIEGHFKRFLDRKQFLLVYAGWDYRYRNEIETQKNFFGQTNTKNNRGVLCAGLQYILPWFIVADFRVDYTGNMRLQFIREDIPVTARLRLSAMYNSDFEYMVGARYIFSKYFSASSHYDSDMGLGGGLTITY